MYLTISPQKLTSTFSSSVRDFVTYLEKENEGISLKEKEWFFSQQDDEINPETVIQEIDANTAKLKRTEPRYYSITINPSKYELNHISSNPNALKEYTREIMKEYAKAFNREINGRPLKVEDIKYFAKVEQQRFFKGTDREVRENAPYLKQMANLRYEIHQVQRGTIKGNISKLQKELKHVIDQAPHKIEGRVIEQGMRKVGPQTHIHIIVSRKDASNSYSLSPGSKYRSSEVMMHGKVVKRGFERDRFFERAEKVFDRMFNYNRNYVESYQARKTFTHSPKTYYTHLSALSMNEKKMAFKMLREAGVGIPHINLSAGQVNFALKQLRKALQIGIRSSSIGY